MKQRRKQRGKEQHEATAAQPLRLIAQEGHRQYHVDLGSYLDTGLFMDHRQTRDWVQAHANNKSVLNIFCYTGAFSVASLLGGAKEVTSVDLSATYLDWLDKNLALNQCDTSKHQRVKADPA